MGWFWTSPSPSPSGTPSSSTTPPVSTTTTVTTTTTTISGDQEIQKFWDMIQQDSRATTNTTKPSPPSTTAPPPQEEPQKTSWLPSLPSLRAPPPPPPTEKLPSTRSPASLHLSELSLPTTLSCRDAFDYAWHCQSPGGQFTAVYRSGGLRSCSELWEDFWFCMRIKSYGPELKKEAIKEWYREKEREKYDGPGKRSSEDVWESRDQKVEGEVFGGFRRDGERK